MSSKKSSGAKNIRVFFRVRPPIGREVEGKHSMNNLILDPTDPTKVTIKRKEPPPKEFYFNRAWGPSSHNNEVYQEFGRNAVDAAFDGQHGVLFVYGQTGSGKTFTISNEDPNNQGVLQQAMKEVWTRIGNDKEHEYKCTLTYVQLYKEALTNLLEDSKDPKDKELRLQTANDGSVTMVKETNGLPVDVSIANYQQTMEYFRVGLSRKETAKTEMNATSSRSHTIFCLSLSKKKITGPVISRDSVELDSNTSYELQGKLYLCDLAGSERASKTQATGNVLDEAASINGSLLVLGRVVAALTDKKAQHVPFRESRLTRILQYSLTGNGNTSLVINVSPSDDNTEETLSAIYFGQRAIQIKQTAKRHEVVDYKALYLQLQADLDSKNDKLIQAAVMEEIAMRETAVAGLQEQLKFAESESALLRKENAMLKHQLAQLNGGVVPPPIASFQGPAPSGGGGGDSAQWGDMINTLKTSLAEKQKALVSAEEDKVKLGHLLAEEKLTVFRLAEKLRAVVIKYQSERTQWSEEHNTLRAEIAQAKGSEYLNVMGGTDADASPRSEAPASPVIDTSNNTGGDISTVLQAQLDRAVQALRELQVERVSLVVYQHKAQQAIKLLAAENMKLGGTLGRTS